MSEKIHIVYATDDGYLLPTFVAAASALAWASRLEDVQIHILDTGIADEGWNLHLGALRRRFGDGAGIVRHQVDLSCFEGLRKYHGSLGTYARLLIPDLLSDAEWCVYCDGDTLFTDDPFKLADVFDARYAYQGHEDWLIGLGNSEQEKWCRCHQLGWDASQYVCSGFILMNLERFRRESLGAACVALLKKYPDAPFVDQDAMAYVCRGSVGRLPWAWGTFSWGAFANGRPSCIHYASDLPWKLMTNKYLDYNDAHRLWFLYAEKFMGLGLREVLVTPVSFRVLVRKYAFGILFRLVRRGCPEDVLARLGALGMYFKRHYASPEVWRELARVNDAGR